MEESAAEPSGKECGKLYISFETLIAGFMVVVALLGALATNRATDRELESVTLDRRLVDGHIIELAEQQQILASLYARYEVRQRLEAAQKAGVDRMLQAERVRARSPDGAVWLE